MSLFQNKFWLYNFFAVIGITAAMGYFVVQHNMSDGIEPTQFVNLTNSDIQKIMSVKTEMQEAKIQGEDSAR